MPVLSEGNYNISVDVCGHSANSAGEFQAISPWTRLPDLGFRYNSFTMDFGNEVYVTAYKSSNVFNLYRFNPASSDFSLVGTVDHSMDFFERPVIMDDKAYLLGTSYSEAQFLVFDRATKTLTRFPTLRRLQCDGPS